MQRYNVACAYAKLGQIDASLAALEETMRQGYDDFGKVRSDPNLVPTRASPKFGPMINKFDEPVSGAAERVEVAPRLFSIELDI